MTTNANRRCVQFDIHLSAQDYLNYYRGTATQVAAKTMDGQTIYFPASALKAFLTHAGISGRFELIYNAQHKIDTIKRVASLNDK